MKCLLERNHHPITPQEGNNEQNYMDEDISSVIESVEIGISGESCSSGSESVDDGLSEENCISGTESKNEMASTSHNIPTRMGNKTLYQP